MPIAAVPELDQDWLSPDFEALFREHSPMVYRTARAVTGNAEDADDILQTVFVRVIRQEYSGQLAKNPRAYLYRTAVNLSLDVLRSRRRRTFTDELDEMEATASGRDSLFDEDLHRRLDDALAELNPAEAQILLLRYVHDYSDAEISKLLGTSRGAIAVRLFRLRARLKKILGGSRRTGHEK
jgi:RNA polymerase sigma-70 factor (ECF subfamily)